MERKAFLRVLAGSVAGLAFTDPVADFLTSTGSQQAVRRVGLPEVEQVRHAARMFADQDHLFGGGMAAQAALTQLSASAQLLDGQFATAAARHALFAAVGDLADTVAGMCFDAGLHNRPSGVSASLSAAPLRRLTGRFALRRSPAWPT